MSQQIPEQKPADSEIGVETESIDMDNTPAAEEKTVITTVIIQQAVAPTMPSMEEYLSKALASLQSEAANLAAGQPEQQQQQPMLFTPNTFPAPVFHNQPQTPSWSFTQGLIIGQVSVIVLIVIFIKFFVFSESTPSTTTTSKKLKSQSPSSRNASKALSKNANHRHNQYQEDENSTIESILEKTYYDVKIHQPESLDWFNVLIAQMISQFRNEALNNDNIYHSLSDAFSSPQIPDFLDKIQISEISIGNDFPIFSNCRIKNNEGRLEAKIDVDVSDTFTLGVETKLLINTPKPLSASLPIKLSVSIVRFSGCLTVSLISTSDAEEIDDSKTGNKTDGGVKAHGGTEANYSTTENGTHTPQLNATSNASNIGTQQPAPATTSSTATATDPSISEDNKNPSVGLMFSFSPDFRLEFEVKSLIGSRTKLENIPRVGSIIENVLRNWFIERCIEPRFQFIQLPSLWPRKKTTRQTAGAGTSTAATSTPASGIGSTVLSSNGSTVTLNGDEETS